MPHHSAVKRDRAADTTYREKTACRAELIRGGRAEPHNLFEALAAWLDDSLYSPRPPAAPCHFPPGSPGRIACYAARLENGEDIFNPADFPLTAAERDE